MFGYNNKMFIGLSAAASVFSFVVVHEPRAGWFFAACAVVVLVSEVFSLIGDMRNEVASVQSNFDHQLSRFQRDIEDYQDLHENVLNKYRRDVERDFDSVHNRIGDLDMQLFMKDNHNSTGKSAK